MTDASLFPSAWVARRYSTALRARVGKWAQSGSSSHLKNRRARRGGWLLPSPLSPAASPPHAHAQALQLGVQVVAGHAGDGQRGDERGERARDRDQEAVHPALGHGVDGQHGREEDDAPEEGGVALSRVDGDAAA